MALISIIIPVYNVEKYLVGCIQSIINQTYSDFEVILVDDGSTDNSAIICDYYSSIDSRIKCLHLINQGVSKARNVGLENAKGDYIAFCDSDDRYSPNFLLEMIKSIEATKADIVICSYYYSNGEINTQISQDSKSYFISREEVFEKIFLNNEIGGFVWNKFFRKSIIDDIRFDVNLQICEDTNFICSVLQRTPIIYYLNKPMYYYTMRDNSSVNNYEKLFNDEKESKYTQAYNKILKIHELTEIETKYIRCAMFLSSSSVKCNYRIMGGKDKEIISNLNKDCLSNLVYVIKNEKIPYRKKIISILNWLFNLRKMKSYLK